MHGCVQNELKYATLLDHDNTIRDLSSIQIMGSDLAVSKEGVAGRRLLFLISVY